MSDFLIPFGGHANLVQRYTHLHHLSMTHFTQAADPTSHIQTRTQRAITAVNCPFRQCGLPARSLLVGRGRPLPMMCPPAPIVQEEDAQMGQLRIWASGGRGTAGAVECSPGWKGEHIPTTPAILQPPPAAASRTIALVGRPVVRRLLFVDE